MNYGGVEKFSAASAFLLFLNSRNNTFKRLDHSRLRKSRKEADRYQLSRIPDQFKAAQQGLVADQDQDAGEPSVWRKSGRRTASAAVRPDNSGKRQMWIQRQFELESSGIAADEVLEAAGPA